MKSDLMPLLTLGIVDENEDFFGEGEWSDQCKNFKNLLSQPVLGVFDSRYLSVDYFAICKLKCTKILNYHLQF